MLLQALGWAFINVVVCGRSDPFTSGNRTHRSFKIFMLFAPIMFVLSSMVMMRSQYELDGYCTEVEKEILHDQPHAYQLRAEAQSQSEDKLFSLTKLEAFMDENGEIDL